MTLFPKIKVVNDFIIIFFQFSHYKCRKKNFSDFIQIAKTNTFFIRLPNLHVRHFRKGNINFA